MTGAEVDYSKATVIFPGAAARIGSTTYATVAEAIAAAKAGDIITLLADAAEPYLLSVNQVLLIEKNGFAITFQVPTNYLVIETTDSGVTTVKAVPGGTCGENLSWTIDENNVLVLEGSGAIDDYAEGTAPWSEFASDIAALEIPEGVTYIGDYAFADLTSITAVVIPDTVAEIGDGAFKDCSSLESVVIPKDCIIGQDAFAGTRIYEPDSFLVSHVDMALAHIGDTVTVSVYLSDTGAYVDPSLLDWTVTTGGELVNAVAPGVYEVCSVSGLVTVVASLKNDPMKHTVTVAFEAAEYPLVTLQDLNGDPVDSIVVDARTVKDAAMVLTLKPVVPEEGITYSYKVSTSDKKIATVKANKDGTFTVTLLKKAAGACVLTFTPTYKDGKKTVSLTPVTLPVQIEDYAPRIAATVSLNTYSMATQYSPVIISYEKQIASVTAFVADKKGAATATPYTDVAISYADGLLAFAPTAILTKSVKIALVFQMQDETLGSYTIPVTLKPANKYPAITAVQNEKLHNYSGSSVQVVLRAADGTAINSAVLSTAGYASTYEDGVLTVTALAGAKANASGTIDCTLDGYRGTAKVKFKIASVAKPALSLDRIASTINAGCDPSFSFSIYDKSTKQTVSGLTVTCSTAAVTANEDGSFTVVPYELKTQTFSFNVSGSDWTVAPVVLKYKLTVLTTMPTMKLKASTITLNTNLPDAEATTTYTLSQSNVVASVSFTCGQAGADKIALRAENGVITANLLPGAMPGVYKFQSVMEVGTELVAGPVLSVSVMFTAPSVKLTASGKLDLTVESSAVKYTVKTSGITGTFDIESVEILDSVSGNPIGNLFNVEPAGKDASGNSILLVTLNPEQAYAVKTYSFKLRLTGPQGIINSGLLKLKVNESKIKVKAPVATQTVYQSQAKTRTVAYTINLTGPVGAAIDQISIGKLESLFFKNLAKSDANIAWAIAPDGRSVTVYVTIPDVGRLSSGKTYKLPLVIHPMGAVDTKADAKLTLTLKVMK